ncbi:MAG TPA: helix-turn-helix transcriptional regulator [Polyangia bacterium]|nr:helix-turn-helix transcriptional regulator [Polyangia bacterium]
MAVFSAANLQEAVEGLLLWGRPGHADVDVIAATRPDGDGGAPRPRALLMDLRRLDCIDLDVFNKLPSLLAPRCRLTDRHAVLHPEGPAGAMAAELFVRMGDGSAARSFVNPREALEWMGVDEPRLIEDLDRMRTAGRGVSSLIGVLRQLLDRSPATTVGDAAREMGVSQRTLQRRLREIGTGFQREVDLQRLRIAEKLMRITRNPLKTIAIEAGYVSPQHFTSTFHRHTGMSPGRWRAAHASGDQTMNK